MNNIFSACCQHQADIVVHNLTAIGEVHCLLLYICYSVIALVLVLMVYLSVILPPQPMAAIKQERYIVRLLWDLTPLLMIVMMMVPIVLAANAHCT